MHRIIYLTVALFCVLQQPSYSQGISNLWLLGFQNIIGAPTTSLRANVDFITGNAVVSPVTRKMKLSETQGNISDLNGNLLMSSNGIWIANAMGDTMMNGNGLNPNQFTLDWANTSVSSLIIQYANLFLPWPGDTNKYVLFHMTGNYNSNPNLGLSGKELFYTVVDKTLDSSLGGVILKNQVAFQDTLTWGISACKHANGRDWWIVGIRNNSNTLVTVLLTPNGVSLPYYHTFLNKISDKGNSCQPTFSPNGKKFAFTTGTPAGSGYSLKTNIFDFDRCTGLFSNHRIVNTPDSSFAIGSAFSANSKYLYTCSVGYIFQINTDSILLKADTVATYDGFISVQGTYFYTMFLAADSRIYVTSMTSVVHQHVINFPDSAGTACDVQQHSLLIPCINGGSVPNHPNYFLGADSTSICDSLTSSISETKFDSQKNLSISPNPATTIITINASRIIGHSASFSIYNSVGELIGKRAAQVYGGYVTQDVYVAELPSGMYVVRLETEREVYVGKFVKE
jgi:Secretion system C-terminal sorting domain